MFTGSVWKHHGLLGGVPEREKAEYVYKYHRLQVLPPDLGFSPQDRGFRLCISLIRSYYLPIKEF